MTSRLPLRILAAAAVALSAAGMLTACSSVDDDPSTLTVGFVVDPSWAQVPVAADTGLFTSHGVTVKVVNFSSGVEALQAAVAGQVDVTTAADVPTAAALAKSSDIKVVGDGARWAGSRIVARKQSGITTVNDLAGKRIGTPIGTSAGYFASNVLDRSKLDADLVQVAPSAVVTAITRGDVDAVSIFQPYQAQSVQALGSEAVVLDGGDYRQRSLYLATTKAISGKRDALTKFFQAISDAGRKLVARDPAAVKAVASATNLDEKLLATVLPEFDFTLELGDLPVKLRELGEWAKAQGKIDNGTDLPDYNAAIDAGFLPTA
ncbi:MAG: ABC transporter substrate-binding protein [Gordonia sp. (in: high G+C Gram-positive bacteria)]|jgi:NitT/TauT family transport system substrate-binding protein|nr:ABC transporter substrate-binding protein [Gordonia sp. (in: high G+C Gram-positive bacteria)]